MISLGSYTGITHHYRAWHDSDTLGSRCAEEWCLASETRACTKTTRQLLYCETTERVALFGFRGGSAVVASSSVSVNLSSGTLRQEL